jgi:hypothetical protein
MQSDIEVKKRAMSVYRAWCERSGVVFQQPSNSLTNVVARVGRLMRIELRNQFGSLATYDISPTGRLMRKH